MSEPELNSVSPIKGENRCCSSSVNEDVQTAFIVNEYTSGGLMPTKLTLKINSLLIKRAKLYAKQHGKSVSKIVSDYFSLWNQEIEFKKPSLPPITRSLRRVIEGADVTEEVYIKYLEDKYL